MATPRTRERVTGEHLTFGFDGTDYHALDVDADGRFNVKNLIYNVDTMAWEASTGTVVDGNLQVNVSATHDDPLGEYRVSDLDVGGDPAYLGFETPAGAWYIMQLNMATGTMRYVKGSLGTYGAAWNTRGAQSYDYFHNVF